MTNLTLTSDLSGLLARVEAAEGADRELDALICVASGYATAINPKSPQFVRIPSEDADFFTRAPPVTASLDAALGLCERVATERGLYSHAVDLLNEAVEAMLVRGWKPNQSLAPQLARYLIVVLLESLIERAEP